ncbi:MAG: arylamine N-acetyltransferase [Ignavibacteria bacterium]|nr:arylamine N-acetyltransferase [Ignavibacteria bacterium]MBT8383330.1 arylamine N-acetyltransferase [Ignavibacteria bacterium]MBT8391402.1 arylamine N-acetyltransferase [Ignavibacteria bacterium]NNJ52420.1 arylamine N-acetyltransferase [Ignavibacteriaceae bacterium]NNL19840.1 arylamine N-acetyltransferase [Ignavibacteriaceae bacterium]
MFLKHFSFMMMKEKELLFEKYLSILALKKSNPNYDFLRKIVKAHLIKIPFENISKLLLKKHRINYIPSLSEYLNGIEQYNFGGTCYANNYYLNLLLKFLGYNIKLCGADMKNPDVHLISIVTIDNKEFIVDCGYAAPLFNPLPRDVKNDFTFSFGDEKYIIKMQDSKGHTKVEQYFNGKLQHWYSAKPEPRKIDEFRKIIKESYEDDATFMNAIRITRFTENGSLVLINLYLTEIVDDNITTTKIERKDLPIIIEQKFGIPSQVVAKATSHLQELKDIYD